MAQKSGTIRAIALFGSMVKGNFGPCSDYDLFIVAQRSETQGFLERVEDYMRLTAPGVHPFVYTESEVEEMMGDFHPLLLDALNDGLIIYDDGFWARFKRKLEELISSGVLKPAPRGWDIHPPTRSQ